MAGCYHNYQDFKSDLKIEVAREGDILHEGQDLQDIICKKNPGHHGFIPFKDLTLEHLPNEIRSREIFDKIKKMGAIVVKLVVKKMKNGRRKKETGSGIVFKFDNEYSIRTNNHVVKTEDDVKHCTVEFHYDDDSRSGVLRCKGVELVWTCPYRDISTFKFHPVPDYLHHHDLLNTKLIPSIVIMYRTIEIVTVDTGLYKKPNRSQTDFLSDVKFSSPINLNRALIELMFILLSDSSYSYFKSCYFKFKPIPSDIQELSSIEVHIDEDDGNSRVIPGHVVKFRDTFGDKFVVKISESIFQDEVKKCRLVWNDEVIGRGTRLYFQQVKSSEVVSGIDLEEQIKAGIENYWIYECHPLPKYLTPQTIPPNIVGCIGHPHGGIKMVTFGKYLGILKERFDNQLRRITDPKDDCQCKEVGCLRYSCKTCPGSSGSPVLFLCKELDRITNYVHFMGERVIGSLPETGERLENINIAWSSIPHD